MLAESQQPRGNNSAASELEGQRTGSAAPVAVVWEGEPWDGRKSPTDLQLHKLLKRLNTGASPLPPFIHEMNVYSTAPEDLVKGRRQAPGTGHGREGSCYFYSVKATAGKVGKRTRKVGCEGDGTWHPEAGAKPILGADGESVVAYKRTFSYTIRSPPPPGMETASRRRHRTGWIMVEISLEEQGDGAEADHMVLCVVHKSKHKYTDTPMAAGQEAAPASDEKVHESLGLPSGDLLSPAPSIDTAGTTTTKLLLQKAAEKAASLNFEMASKIHEFVEVKELHLRTIDQLGLDRSIVSGPLDKLEVLLQDIAIIKALTPDERGNVVSCGEDVSSTICHAYLNVLAKRLRRDFSALEKIGFNVHCQVSQKASKVTNVSLVVHDSEGKQRVQVLLSKVEGAENERPVLPVDSSSSGEKRKALDDHPEAPPSARQELTDADHSFLREVELGLLSDNNDPVSVGADNLGHRYKIFEDIINEDEPIGDDDDGGESAGLFVGMPPILEEDLQEPIGVGDGWDSAGLFAGMPPIVEEDLQETIGVSDGGDLAGLFAGMPPVADEYLQKPTGLHDGGDSGGLFALVEPIGVDVGDWATGAFGCEAEERQGLAEMAECSTAPRRVPEEERMDTNCGALKASRLRSGVDDDGWSDLQYYCFDFDDGAPGDGDDQAWTVESSQQPL